MRKYKTHDLGDGERRHAVYNMPVVDDRDYWANVTDVACPVCPAGTIRWHEAGGVPGSRICDTCGRFFQAQGSVAAGVILMRDSRFDQ